MIPLHLGELNSTSGCVPRFNMNLNPDESGGGSLSITVAGEEEQHIGLEGKYRWEHEKETRASVQLEPEPKRKLPSKEAWREGCNRGRGKPAQREKPHLSSLLSRTTLCVF